MKKINTIYWIVTSLFAAFMLFSAIPDMLMVPEAKAFMNHIGYPDYFIPFIGVLKLLGSVAILIPGYPTIKEWAYAGLFFDLMGATYSIAATDGVKPDMLGMLLPFAFWTLSYVYFHKRLSMREAANKTATA